MFDLENKIEKLLEDKKMKFDQDNVRVEIELDSELEKQFFIDELSNKYDYWEFNSNDELGNMGIFLTVSRQY